VTWWPVHRQAQAGTDNAAETPPKPQNPNETKRRDGKHMETSRSYGHILWPPMVWPPMVWDFRGLNITLDS
jgi:hypothetical protein